MDALRLRLEEKEATLNKKSKQIQEISEEKGTLTGEIHDLKDMLDVKERKVIVLQKKVILIIFIYSFVFLKIALIQHSLCGMACLVASVQFECLCSVD